MAILKLSGRFCDLVCECVLLCVDVSLANAWTILAVFISSDPEVSLPFRWHLGHVVDGWNPLVPLWDGLSGRGCGASWPSLSAPLRRGSVGGGEQEAEAEAEGRGISTKAE